MENFIEKLKGLDKKVWIGVGIGAAVLVILIIALVIGLGNKPASNKDNSQNGTQAGILDGTENGSEVFNVEGLETEVIGTEIATETEMGTEVESEGGTTVTQNPDVNGVTQQPTTTKPDGEEILGMGTKNNPYYETPDLTNMTVTTVTIPAGTTLYYNIYRVGGMYLNISDSSLYVIDSSGTRHDSSFVVENALASDAVSFQIGNKGTTAKTFTIKFSNLKGSYQNPEKLTSAGPHTKHLNAGDEEGYYYKYNATQAGVLRIYMTATADTEMNVQNNSGVGTVAKSFTEDFLTDENGKEYIELNVNSGDEIRIHIQAIKPTRGSRPATDVTFEFVYK